MSTIASLTYTTESGERKGHDVTVYALSTCGFCKRGLQFLRDNKIAFKFVYVDQLEYDTKQKVKDELQAKYDARVVFPYMVLDEKEVVTGFVEEKWREVFNV
jgi:glutaredoxin